MAITPEQRLERRGFIGSSDSPAIVGFDPWKTAHDVYLEKRHEVAEIEDNLNIRLGNLLEPLLVELACEELGIEAQRNVRLIHPNRVLAANLDACNLELRINIEAKFKGWEDLSLGADEFGEAGTDQVPSRTIVQALHQMECAPLDVTWVPVFRPKRGRLVFEMYKVPRNEEGQAAIVERDLEFWHSHVLPGVPPLDTAPSLDLVRRIERHPDKVARIDPAIVSRWEAAKAAKKEAEKVEEEVKAQLLAQLGDAEAGDWGDPGRWLTFFEQDRKEFISKAVRFRVARIANRK